MTRDEASNAQKPRTMGKPRSTGTGRAIIFLLLLTILLICGGWGNTWEQIQSAAQQIKTIEARFIQEKHLKILSKPLISKGVFYFQSPHALRWEYTAPFKSILLMQNGVTRRYTHNGASFVEDARMNVQGMQVVLQQIVLWLEGRFNDDPTFHATLAPERTVVLTPHQKAFAQMIQKIELKLSDTPGILETVTIYEGPESFTRLRFSNAQINQRIPKTVFQDAS